MAIDWNADVGDVMKQLFSSQSTSVEPESQSTPEGIGMALMPPILLILVITLFFFLIYQPLNSEVEQMQHKVAQIPLLELKQTELKVSHQKSDEAIRESTARVSRIHQMMFAHREIDHLYRKVQEWAQLNQLEVVTLRKVGVNPVTAVTVKEALKGKRAKGQKVPAPLFYRIELMLKIRGEFLNYLQLRGTLNRYQKMLQVNREQIRAIRLLNHSLDEEVLYRKRGQVEVDMVLSAYQSDETGREDKTHEQ